MVTGVKRGNLCAVPTARKWVGQLDLAHAFNNIGREIALEEVHRHWAYKRRRRLQPATPSLHLFIGAIRIFSSSSESSKSAQAYFSISS